MGRTRDNGVVDHRGEVFGYRNLFVADGAIVPEALGLNPSKTIAALAERIVAHHQRREIKGTTCRESKESSRRRGAFSARSSAPRTRYGPTAAPAGEFDPGLESLESSGAPMPRTIRGGASLAELTPSGRAGAAETESQIQDGLEAMKKIDMGRDDEITDRDQHALEAIVLLAGRPAILIEDGDFMDPPETLGTPKGASAIEIKEVIRRVGRIEVSNNPNFEWLGTGWLAGKDVVITNRHVALEFSRRANDGTWTFRAPMGASLNLHAELNSESALTFTVKSIIGIHDDHDMAALQVEQAVGRRSIT